LAARAALVKLLLHSEHVRRHAAARIIRLEVRGRRDTLCEQRGWLYRRGRHRRGRHLYFCPFLPEFNLPELWRAALARNDIDLACSSPTLSSLSLDKYSLGIDNFLLGIDKQILGLDKRSRGVNKDSLGTAHAPRKKGKKLNGQLLTTYFLTGHTRTLSEIFSTFLPPVFDCTKIVRFFGPGDRTHLKTINRRLAKHQLPQINHKLLDKIK
jgi:hypothetical protein